jgi:hypothetical protein
MENNNKTRELYSIYLELGHEVFEEKIKKPMELYLHANSNIISMNSLNTIIANAMEKSKLGEAGFDEHDLFSPPSTKEKIYFDDTIPPIYDDYMMNMIFSVHLLLRRKLIMITICLLYLRIMVMRIILIVILLNLLPLQLIRMAMLMWRVIIILCMWLMIRMFYVIVILLILFMMLLKVIMREGNMVLCISTILSFPSLC